MTTSVKTENPKISSVESGRTTEKRLFSLLTDDPTQKDLLKTCSCQKTSITAFCYLLFCLFMHRLTFINFEIETRELFYKATSLYVHEHA